MDCRPACGACCEAPSISSPLPGHPGGKPSGLRCPYLDERYRCVLYGRPERPAICSALRPEPSMCGSSRAQALAYLALLERETAP
ncbi:MAG: zinc/iron-chelating domain-containing protein [Spirochaetae bacterium HGW-Spirochaetae-3]|nr:MAG: zinc/iron-chelating domain-containing protein [Spirochaetae bacterium HGW-Spirochaetae-3]